MQTKTLILARRALFAGYFGLGVCVAMRSAGNPHELITALLGMLDVTLLVVAFQVSIEITKRGPK
jgi:hypothetical protein